MFLLKGPDHLFINMHTHVFYCRISMFWDKHCHMFLDTKVYFVIQISHLSKGLVIEAFAICHL